MHASDTSSTDGGNEEESYGDDVNEESYDIDGAENSAGTVITPMQVRNEMIKVEGAFDDDDMEEVKLENMKQINKIKCEDYPPHLQDFIIKERRNFGRYDNLKSVKELLGMYDGLDWNKSELKKSINGLFQRYYKNISVTKPKNGKNSALRTYDVFEMLYIQYMLLENDTGNYDDFLDKLPNSLCINARLFDVLNSKVFKLNVKTMIKAIKRAVKAVANVELKIIDKRFHPKLARMRTKWKKIRNTLVVLEKENIVTYTISKNERNNNNCNELTGATFDDYQNSTIRTEAFRQFTVVSDTSNRFEFVPFLLLEEFKKAIFNDATNCYFVKFYNDKNKNHRESGQYVLVAIPAVVHEILDKIIHKLFKPKKYVFVTLGYYKCKKGQYPSNGQKTLTSMKKFLPLLTDNSAVLASINRIQNIHQVLQVTHVSCKELLFAANHDFERILLVIFDKTGRKIELYAKDSFNWKPCADLIEEMEKNKEEPNIEQNLRSFYADTDDDNSICDDDFELEGEAVEHMEDDNVYLPSIQNERWTRRFSISSEDNNNNGNDSADDGPKGKIPDRRRIMLSSSSEEELPQVIYASQRKRRRIINKAQMEALRKAQIIKSDEYTNKLMTMKCVNAIIGHGMFAKKKIEKRTIICEYRGKLRTDAEGERKQKEYTAEDGCFLYFFRVDIKGKIPLLSTAKHF
uniref:Uncharacterized protein n=1 Tax=Panagrolaimus sp. ES5 TaxID=591445 RepID=A0AC34FZD6_9BILA